MYYLIKLHISLFLFLSVHFKQLIESRNDALLSKRGQADFIPRANNDLDISATSRQRLTATKISWRAQISERSDPKNGTTVPFLHLVARYQLAKPRAVNNASWSPLSPSLWTTLSTAGQQLQCKALCNAQHAFTP